MYHTQGQKQSVCVVSVSLSVCLCMSVYGCVVSVYLFAYICVSLHACMDQLQDTPKIKLGEAMSFTGITCRSICEGHL